MDTRQFVMHLADDPGSGGGGGGAESGPLTLDGRRLRRPDGSVWFGVGVSWYRGLHDWVLDRSKCRRFLTWMQSRRLQWARVFLQFNGYPNPGIGRFIPAEIPNYLGYVPEYVQFCADGGIRLELVTYADCQNPGSTFDPSFLDQINDLIGGKWNLLALSAGNEYAKNGFDPAALRRPKPLASQTSIGPNHQPYTPAWDVNHMAANRDGDWERKYKDIRDQFMGDNPDPPRAPYAFPSPIYIGEMIGIGEDDIPGNTTNDAFKCWQYTAGAKIMGACGVCGHLRTGIFGDVPPAGGKGEACMEAMVQAGALPLGANSFDEYQRGNSPWEGQNPNLPVVHHDSAAIDGPDGTHYPANPYGSLRTHAMIAGSRAEVIAPGPGDLYRMVAKPGWRIAQPFQYRDHASNVAVCERT